MYRISQIGDASDSVSAKVRTCCCNNDSGIKTLKKNAR